ncbi:MAG: hypothetical protein HY834_14755 [Devosia nanyangense]|uniref:Uncharacterized protein n=1 Tax=Devosia nanyangense TaxID=1228055 RepID=A0A933NZX7_9HYPH|nr:hypothetical protein [Devosia nanyangense]
MTAAKKPSLDPAIARLTVTPEARRLWAWPLVGLLERPVTSQRDVAELAFCLNVILPRYGSVAEEADAVIALCRSRSRSKPGARLVLLLAALGAQGAPTPDKVLQAVAAALRVAPRDVQARVGLQVDWLPHPETTALKVIARLAYLQDRKALQGEERAVRLAVYDLVCWHRQQGRVTSPVALNALACLVGLVDPVTAKVDWSLLGVGHDLRDELRVADYETAARSTFEYRAVLARQVGRPVLQRRAEGTDRFNEAVDRALLESLPEGEVSVAALIADTRDRVLHSPLPALADLAGLTDEDLLQMVGDPDPEFDKALERVRPRRPGLDETTAALGLRRATAATLRNAAAPLVEQRLVQADAPRREEEGLRALQADAFAAANGDPEAKARLRAMCAPAVASPVADVSNPSRLPARPARR